MSDLTTTNAPNVTEAKGFTCDDLKKAQAMMDDKPVVLSIEVPLSMYEDLTSRYKRSPFGGEIGFKVIKSMILRDHEYIKNYSNGDKKFYNTDTGECIILIKGESQ